MKDLKSAKFKAKVQKRVAELAAKTPGEWNNYYQQAFMELAFKQNLWEKIQGWFRVMSSRLRLHRWVFAYKHDPLLMVYHVIFWFYYKRVAPFYRQYRILKSIDTLWNNYVEEWTKNHPEKDDE